MIFEEFKSLALNPPYIDRPCIYRVDTHRYTNQKKDASDVMEYAVRLCDSVMYADWDTVERVLPGFIHNEFFNKGLYAIYIYQLPINIDVSYNQYQRLWVYDREGNLSAHSICSALIEDLDTSSAKFRGRDAESIHFNVGDIVEVYDRDEGKVRLGVVMKQPPTIEQCWATRKEVEKECIAEGIDVCMTDENYWRYSMDDCYWIVYGQGCEMSDHHTTDIFYPMSPISDRLRQYFAECYTRTIELHHDRIKLAKLIFEC